jgi:DNA-binding CsgD family transcriptional regulator
MRTVLAEERFYELVELIYAAAQAPDQWQTFVSAFAEAVPGTSAALMVRSAVAEGGVFMVHAMFSPGAIPEFLRNHADSSPWITVLRSVETGVPFATEDHVPLASIRSTEFYRELLKPHRIAGGFGVKLWDRVDGRAMFIATCGEDLLVPMKIKLLPVIERLTPHLQRSLALCWALRRERARGLEEGLARQADAVFVLNKRREVVFTNAAGRKALEEKVVKLNSSTQRLRLSSAKDSAAFDHLVDLVSASAPLRGTASRAQQHVVSKQRRIMTFTAPGASGPNLLEILPLPSAEASPAESIFLDKLKEPHVLVTVRRRGGLSAPSIEDIRIALNLSQKEAEVTLAIVEGRSIEEFATSRQVSVDTVRWHLKNIYRRTDCSSQADLLRLVLSLVGRANLG